jgi:hypothetical protein
MALPLKGIWQARVRQPNLSAELLLVGMRCNGACLASNSDDSRGRSLGLLAAVPGSRRSRPL